jgi:hypothetical protein
MTDYQLKGECDQRTELRKRLGAFFSENLQTFKKKFIRLLRLQLIQKGSCARIIFPDFDLSNC